MTRAFINGDPLHDIIIPYACLTDSRIDASRGDDNKLIRDESKVGSSSSSSSAARSLPCTICGKARWRYSCMGCCYSDLYKVDPLYRDTLEKYGNDLPIMIQSIEQRISNQEKFIKKVRKTDHITAITIKRDNLAREIASYKEKINILKGKIAVISASNRDTNKEDFILRNDTLQGYTQELDDEMLAESDVRNDMAAFINDGDAAAHGDSPPYEVTTTLLGGLNSFHAYHRLRANIHALTAHRSVLCQQLREVYPVLWSQQQGYTPPSSSWSPSIASRSGGGYTGDGTDSNPTPVDSIGSLSESRMFMSRSWLTSSQIGASSSDIGDLRSMQGAITKYSQLVPAIACISQILQVNLPFPCQFGVIGNTTTPKLDGYGGGGGRGAAQRPSRRQLPLEPRILHPYSDLSLPLVPVSNAAGGGGAGLSASSYNRHTGLDPHKMLREDIRFLSLICGTGVWSEQYHMDDLSAARELINSPDIGRLYTRARLDQSISISNSMAYGGGGDISNIEYITSDDTTITQPTQQQQQLTSGFIDEIEWNILD